ncbi:MAG TPA: rhodanese-like domain-containing protein [Candidatus Binatia bacterium]|nr:rhodanese-like domain-containing protein [Candidatus Binatia bacterium]
MRNVLLEAVMVAAIGALLGFFANWLSPRGLSLTRDFFFLSNRPVTNAVVVANPTQTLTATNPVSPLEQGVRARLGAEGLHVADSNLVLKLFHDPRCQQGLVVFIDAREPGPFAEGHIPGAYELDYYHPDAYLPTVMPLCVSAEQVVVYCNGGNCEDSEHAAQMLGSIGVPREKLFVYAGGIVEWETNGMPVELGERKSGRMKGPTK